MESDQRIPGIGSIKIEIRTQRHHVAMKDQYMYTDLCLGKRDSSCHLNGKMHENIRGMAGKFVDTIGIFNRKRNSVKMNISGFAKIFHEQIDEIL